MLVYNIILQTILYVPKKKKNKSYKFMKYYKYTYLCKGFIDTHLFKVPINNLVVFIDFIDYISLHKC